MQLDVVSDTSINAALAEIMKAPDARLDTLIHNAGHMSFGVAEAFTPDQFSELYDLCFVSTQRINEVILPHMHKAGRVLLAWVKSSSAQDSSSPFLAPYSKAKAAIDSPAQTYGGEVSRWGIETTIVVPGIFHRRHESLCIKWKATRQERRQRVS